jgi:hypothetical protein
MHKAQDTFFQNGNQRRVSPKDPRQALQKLAKKEIYRLFVDGRFHEDGQGWYDYEFRQESCIPALFKGLKVAFSHLNNKVVTTQLIKDIHKQVAENVCLSSEYSGNFRDSYTVNVFHKNYDIFDEQGFKELFSKTKESYKQTGACFSFVDDNYLSNLRSKAEYHERLEKLTGIAEENVDKIWRIANERRDDQLLAYRYPSYELIPELIEEACEQYNNEMLLVGSSSDDNKLDCILRFIQRIEQIHPFGDGNVRTVLLLLQRLLLQNNMLPTMMFDPNHLDGYSFAALKEEVKQGIAYTSKLIANPDAVIFGYQTSEVKLEYAYHRDTVYNVRKAEEMFYSFLQSEHFFTAETETPEKGVDMNPSDVRTLKM